MSHSKPFLIVLALAVLATAYLMPAVAQADGPAITLVPIGHYDSGVHDESAVEIVAYDPVEKELYISNAYANAVDVLDLSDPTRPSKTRSLDMSPYGGGVNSVAFYSYSADPNDGYLAVAVEGESKQDAGTVAVFHRNGDLLFVATVGVLPDMVTFTPDGQKIIVACEGEPNDDYTIDPEGSVNIISGVKGKLHVSTASFALWNDRKTELIEQGVRIFGPNATVAQDLEPEYIAVSADSRTAYVSLQENNALAVIDIDSATVTHIFALGYKDHSKAGNGFDASDKDGAINIRTWPTLGMYQPDAIAAYEVGGQTYVVSANEGDARDYDGYSEETRVDKLDLDSALSSKHAGLTDDAGLGRLKTTTANGDTDGDGDFDQIYSYGSRSFSIWNGTTGQLVYDSGDAFERLSAKISPTTFNSQGTGQSFDERSDDKGGEPEGVTIGVLDGRTYAFVCLERTGAILVYDVSDPTSPVFQSYNTSITGYADLSPEGLAFIPADQSPTGRALLVAAYEYSGTVTVFEVLPEGGKATQPTPVTAADGSTCGEVYTVQAGDWLAKIAAGKLGDATQYTAIVDATNKMHTSDASFAIVEDPNVIDVGWKLCIPGQ
jgi:DNA-binding beta-propeller fold protein YncE